MKDILVVGGAGYIGSHMCKYLDEKGLRPVVLDNLIYGHREAARWGRFYEGGMTDEPLLDRIFSENEIAAVMHFAAFCYVGESVQDPAKYYENNVIATLRLIAFMMKRGVENFIFSSSCATYGDPVEIPMRESHPQMPINPYGRTKLMVEQALRDYRTAYGLRSVALRYFNAAGADPDGELGEDHDPETHLIPLVLKTALGQRDAIEVFGDDYPTEDGTCARDYIHVRDLAQAHYLALEKLFGGAEGGEYNLGNGNGFSVKEVIETGRRITGRPIPERIGPRRAGDPATLVGSAEKAVRELGWRPEYSDLTTMMETAWKWFEANPNGYA